MPELGDEINWTGDNWPKEDRWRACNWRAGRILRFADRQPKKRQWVRFTELAELYATKADDERSTIGRAIAGVKYSGPDGFEQLRLSVINGEFERLGRSRVLYLHPGVAMAKMTRERMANISETYYRTAHDTLRRQYLACCWIPYNLASEWCRGRNLSLPVRRPLGRSRIDDSAEIIEGRRLMAKMKIGKSEAARQLAATVDHHGAQFDSVVQRFRRKL